MKQSHIWIILAVTILFSCNQGIGGSLGMIYDVRMKFDFDRGRIDTAIHPACYNFPEDVRISTRFKENDPTDCLYSLMHETGHGLYSQKLPLNFAWNKLA